jgi:hypothetical protein
MLRWWLRKKRVPSVCHRALEVLAAHSNGCTEAALAAHEIPVEIVIGLIKSGLAKAHNERVVAEGGANFWSRRCGSQWRGSNCLPHACSYP